MIEFVQDGLYKWIEYKDKDNDSNDEKQHTSAMIALRPSPELAQQLAVTGGEEPGALHITLLYIDPVPEYKRQVLETLMQGLVARVIPVKAKINGITLFTETHVPDKNAVVLNIDSPQLIGLRDLIDTMLREIECYPKNDHGFTPHMTLAYVDKDISLNPADYNLPTEPIYFDDLWLVWKDEWIPFPIRKFDSKETSVAQRIAEQQSKVDAPTIQSELLDPWLITTMGTEDSNRMQKTVAKTFGHSYPAEFEELDINWNLLYAVGAIYNLTQEWLSEKGFSETETIPVYHPYLPNQAVPKQWQEVDTVRIKLNPLTSWTLDLSEAVTFADFLASPGSPTFVLKTFIPVSSIVSTPETGFGVPGTNEVVLAGGEYEAVVEQRFE